jgi:hypothetical protein
VIASEVIAISVGTWAAQQPVRAWRHVTWRNGQNRPWAALFVAVRVTPITLWRRKQRLDDVWLLCQRPLGATTASKHDKYFLSDLPRRPRCARWSGQHISDGRSSSNPGSVRGRTVAPAFRRLDTSTGSYV